MLLYVHVPFCVRKCHYCAFCSGVFTLGAAARFVREVTREIVLRAARFRGRRVSSVYLGGGTPSLLEVEQVGTILDALRRYFVFAEDAEITLEANPGSVSRPGFLSGLRTLGINRLSLGVQSFREDVLRLLGRRHSAQEAKNAVCAARQAGFANISLDFMWGLPGQSVADWLEDLSRAVDLGPEHLSCYGLTLEEGTVLAAWVRSGRVTVPDDEMGAEMYLRGASFLDAQGFPQYEISNYARPGRESRHNIGYWDQREYLGLGPAAVSTLGRVRQSNPESLEEYETWVRRGCPLYGQEVLSVSAAARETVMLSLRQSKGLDVDGFKAKTGYDFLGHARAVVEHLCSSGLARVHSGHFQLTREGMLLSDSVIGMLFEEVGSMQDTGKV